MEALYIITTESKQKKNIYKPGIHTGTIKKLTNRYSTYFMNPVICFFCYIETSKNKEVEKLLKLSYIDKRLTNTNGNKSEWINDSLIKIQTKLYKLLKNIQYTVIIDKTNNINENINSDCLTENISVTKLDKTKDINVNYSEKILEIQSGLIESYVEQVHFNPDKPQFHNIYYGDIKSGYGYMYSEKGWVQKNINEILDSVINTTIKNLNEILEKDTIIGQAQPPINNQIREKLKYIMKLNHNVSSTKIIKKNLKATLFNGSKTIDKPKINK